MGIKHIHKSTTVNCYHTAVQQQAECGHHGHHIENMMSYQKSWLHQLIRIYLKNKQA